MDIGSRAPTSSLDIATTGFVGIGTVTAAPTANLHVSSTTTTKIALESRAVANPSNWQLVTAANTGIFSLADETSSTVPLRINQGAPTDSLRIAANGSLVLGNLKNCANGVKTNASGALSCMPANASPHSVTAGDNLSLVNLASAAGAGPSAVREASTATAASGAKPQEAESAATCSEADMTGSWGMVGNTGDGSSGSVMWCDVQLTKAAKAYSIVGKCRSHSVNTDAPTSYDLRGERSISLTSACKLSGNFKLVGGNETVTASIVEGRVQGLGKSRAVGVSRWQSGKSATLQTFVMQR